MSAGSWPLVGRGEELVLIDQELAGAGARGVVVAGAAGVGKSRLVAEAVARAQARGMAAESVRASYSAAAIPFGALAHLVSLEAGAGERLELFGLIAEALADRARGRPLVIGVDDAHLLDDSSAAFVAFLADSGRAFVVAGVRTGEQAPDAVVNLWKDGVVPRIELQPLSRLETEELLESALGGQIDGATMERLWNATRGNPLFLRELVLATRAGGQLLEAAGVWHWPGSFPPAPRLIELVEQRLGRVAAAERSVLDVVAIAEPVPLAVLESIASAEVVAATAATRLLEIGDERARTQVRLVHPLYAEVLRAQSVPLLARDLKRKLAEAFERMGCDEPDDLLRVATWRLDSGAAERPDVLIAAARRAIALLDFELGVRLAQAAVAAGGGVPAESVLAQALIGKGSFADAEALLQEVQGRCETELECTRVITTRAQNLFWRLLDQPAARALLDEAAPSVTSPAARQELDSARAMFLLFEGDPDTAIATASEVLEAGGRLGVEAAMTLCWALIVVGRFDRALSVIDGALETLPAVEAEIPFSRDWLVKSRSAADHFAGRLDRATQTAATAYQAAIRRGAHLGRAMHAFALGWVDLTAGRIHDAARHQREAAAVFREFNIFGHLPGALGELAQAEALLGNAPAAEAALAEAEASRTNRMDEVMVGLARAWTAAARGELSSARAHALRAAEATGSLGQRTFQAVCLHHALRLGEGGVAADVLTLARDIDGDLVAAMAAHADAHADGRALGLEDVSRSFEAIGARLLAAEASAGASRAHAQDGREASARAAAARASALAERCGVTRTPMLGDLTAAARLTVREHEIACLAASQLSSREIAERLVLSVRTVDNHLRNVYLKLGVGSRSELAPLLGLDRVE